MKDAQRGEHGALGLDLRKSRSPQFVAQGRWRFEFDMVAPRSSGHAPRMHAKLRKLAEAVQRPLVDVGAEVNPARFENPDDLPMTLCIIARIEIPKNLDRVDEIDRGVGRRQLQHRAVGNKIGWYIFCGQATHLGTRFDAGYFETLIKQASHVGAHPASNIEARRPVRQLRYAAHPRAIDEMAPISEGRVEDIVAAILGKKSVCSFIVDFDGPAA